MAKSDIEIAVEDPTAPEPNSPAVTSNRGRQRRGDAHAPRFAVLLGYDNWRTGMSWEATGPQAGYMPFYLSVILGGAAVYGFATSFARSEEARDAFVTWAQLRRVLQVLVPTFLFVLCTAWLGLYVSSFFLISGFMWIVGRIALWKSALAAIVFTAAMFFTFQIAFDVIMPKGPLEAVFGY